MYLFSCSPQKMSKMARVFVTRLSACAFVPPFFSTIIVMYIWNDSGRNGYYLFDKKKKRTLYDVIFASCVLYMRQDH